jgi:hypothetical protein
MNRVKTAGLCVVVACALVAVAGVSSASAAEFGQCVSMKRGNYTESNCATVAEKAGVPDHKGTFEFEAADTCYETTGGNFTESECKTVAEKKGTPDHKGSFESTASPTFGTSSGPTEWTTPGFGAYACKSSTGTGAITSGTTVTQQIVLHGCESFAEKCQNTATEGEIVSNPLVGALTEPSAGQAATVLTAAPGYGGYLFNYSCVGLAFIRTGGSVGGHNTPVNTEASSSTFTFETRFDQDLENEYSASPEFGPSETEGPFPTEAHGVMTIKTSAPGMTHLDD